MSIIKRKAGSEDIVKSVLEFDEVPTEGSPNMVESGAVAGAIAKGGKIAVFEVSPGEGKPYPTYAEIKSEVLAGKTVVLRRVNYDGRSDSPADYYYLHNYRSAPSSHSYSFVHGSSIKTVTSNNEWSDASTPRYKTRTETAESLPALINVNGGESVLYNVTTSATTANINVAAPAGTTDAQVVVVKTSGYFIPTIRSVTVGGVDLPIIDTRAPQYYIDYLKEGGILRSVSGDCSVEVPTSFDEVEIASDVITDVDIKERSQYESKIVIQIMGQVALVFGTK